MVPLAVSHAAMPSLGGAGHAVHDVPQLATAVSETQVPAPAPQRWKPLLHANAHALLVHTGTAFGSDDAGHVTHADAVPHWSVLSSGKQPLVAGHMCVPVPQT